MPPVNPPWVAAVPGSVVNLDRFRSRATPTERRAPRRARGAGFWRFFTFSLGLHAAIAVAGITGGAAYQRRAGAESRPAAIVFATAPEPITTSSVVTPTTEPERDIENEVSSSEPEPSPISPEAEFDVELPLTPASELAADAASARSISDPTALDRAIGDPRASWRLPSTARTGLQIGLETEPPVSDCCGEPQPPPAKEVASSAYLYPEVVKMARAEFPLKSQRLGEEGSVLLEMTVGADGLVKDVRVAESSGYLRIDDCAAAAAWDWIFKPAARNGVPEVAIARHRYTFRLMGAGGCEAARPRRLVQRELAFVAPGPRCSTLP